MMHPRRSIAIAASAAAIAGGAALGHEAGEAAGQNNIASHQENVDGCIDRFDLAKSAGTTAVDQCLYIVGHGGEIDKGQTAKEFALQESYTPAQASGRENLYKILGGIAGGFIGALSSAGIAVGRAMHRDHKLARGPVNHSKNNQNDNGSDGNSLIFHVVQ